MHHLLQAIYELAMVLATRSLCNLASLNVFGDDIPQVAILEVTHKAWESLFTQVHKRLQDDLAAISSLVKGRGGDYDYLDPENVACSIDIWTLETQTKTNELLSIQFIFSNHKSEVISYHMNS